MTLTVSGLVILIIIAAICGAIGRALAGGRRRGGLLMAIVLGFIGALLGVAIARQLHLPEPLLLTVSGERFPILWSIVGAALLVAVVQLVSGRR